MIRQSRSFRSEAAGDGKSSTGKAGGFIVQILQSQVDAPDTPTLCPDEVELASVRLRRTEFRIGVRTRSIVHNVTNRQF
jgi:hypothetical protein